LAGFIENIEGGFYWNSPFSQWQLPH